jgi:hypothetical protein
MIKKQKNNNGFALLSLLVGLALSSVSVLSAGFLNKDIKKIQEIVTNEYRSVQAIKNESSYLDESVLKNSRFTSNVVGTVILSDGSYSVYKIVDAKVVSDGEKYEGASKFKFLSGDIGLDEYQSNVIDPFYLKDGSKVMGSIVDKMVVGLQIPNKKTIPLKVLSGVVKDGKFVGDIVAQTFYSNYLIAGNVNENGEFVGAKVLFGAKNTTEAENIVSENALSLFDQIAYQDNEKVLGAQTVNIGNYKVQGATKPVFDSNKGTWVFPGSSSGTISTSSSQNIVSYIQNIAQSVTGSQPYNSLTGTNNNSGVSYLSNYPSVNYTTVVSGIKDIKSGNPNLKITTNDGVSTISIDLAGVQTAYNALTQTNSTNLNGYVKGDYISDNAITSSKIQDYSIGPNKLTPQINFGPNQLIDLSAVNYNSSSPQGLRLPMITSVSPVRPAYGRGYIAWDSVNNRLAVYDGTNWSPVSSSSGSGSSSGVALFENNTAVVPSLGNLNFSGSDFNVTPSSSSAATVSIDYSSSKILRSDQSSSITSPWVFSNGLTLSSGSLSLPAGSVQNAALANSAINIVAGSGLTGGGSSVLGSSSTINIGSGAGITVGTDSISVDTSIIPTTSNLATLTNKTISAITNTITNLTPSNFVSNNISQWTNNSGYISGVSWGQITGTLSNQTDLKSALDLKADVSGLGTISTQNANNVSITGGTINDATVGGIASGLSISANTNTISNLTNSNFSGSAGITNANLANSSLNINSSGILTGGGSVSLGGSLTLTATEADTLATVLGRGAESSTPLTLSSSTPIVFSGTTPTISFSNGDTTFDLTGATTRTLNIINSTAGQVAGLSVEGNIVASNFSGSSSGANTGDNAANSNYANDYRSSNFVAGTNYLTPSGSAAGLTNFPTLNQSTTGNALTSTTATTSNTIANTDAAGQSVISAINSATSGTINSGKLSSSVTLLGNTFNGANELVKLNSAGGLPIIDGSLLSNLSKSQVGLSNVENTALSTWTGSSNITTLGNVTSGNLNSGVSIDFNGTTESGTASIDITGNASTVTNGLYSNGSYANPAWITSLSSTKVLPSVSGNSGKVLGTNGSTISWVDNGSGGVSWGQITGTLSNQTDLTTALGLKADSSSLGTLSGQNSNSVNITGGILSGLTSVAATTFTGSLTGNASTVTGLSVGSGKVLSSLNSITLSGNDSSTLNIGSGGTLGSAAFSNTSDYATAQQGVLATNALPALSFSDTNVNSKLLTGYSQTTGTVTSSDSILSAISKIVGNYTNDYRSSNFVAGTNYLAPNGSAASLTNFPTLNQNTTGTASNITSVLGASSFPSLTGDVTTTQGNLSTAIASGAVTLSKMSNLASNTIIGNNTGVSATPIALTPAQVKTLLGITTSDVSGLGTISTQNANNVSITGGTLSGLTSVAATTFTGSLTGNASTVTGFLPTSGKTLSVLKTMSLTSADDTGVYTLPTGTATLLSTTGSAAGLTNFPTLNQNTTGTAAGLSSILSSTTGGSGVNNAGTLTWGSGGTLGTAAYTSSSSYATSAQGTLATNALPLSSFTDVAVTGKLLTGYISGSGTVAATDSILQALQKLNGNEIADYDASNFVAGTNYLAPNGSAAGLTNFPTLNQSTTGNALTSTTATTSNTIANTDTAGQSVIAAINSASTGTINAARIAALPYMSTTLSSANILIGNGSNIATGVALSGDATIDNTGVITIGSSKITLSKMANIATASLLGRSSAGTGAPEVLSATSAKSILGITTSDVSGLGTVSTQNANGITLTGGSINGITIGATTAGTGTFTTITANTSITRGTDTITDFTGNGLTLNTGALTVSLTAAADGLSATTSSGSGLEVLANGVSLLQGCSDGQVLKWNETTDVWSCQNDSTSAGGGVNTIKEGGVTIASSTSVLNFNSSDFIVTDETGGQAGIAIDYTNSHITRDNQTQTVSAAWNFSAAQTFSASNSITLGTSSANNGGIVFKNSTNANTVTLQSGATSGSYVWTLPTADATGCVKSNGSGTLSVDPACGETDYQTFTANGSYTVKSNTLLTVVQAWGPGGGGGGGGSNASGTAATGGGGGGGGAYNVNSFNSVSLGSVGSTITVTVPSGGSGGAGGNNAIGSNGSAATSDTTFGALLTAYRGGGGAKGNNTATLGGGGGGGGTTGIGNSSTSATGGAGGTPSGGAANANASPGGGGGGGGSTAAGGNAYMGGGGGAPSRAGGTAGFTGGTSQNGGGGGGAGGSEAATHAATNGGTGGGSGNSAAAVGTVSIGGVAGTGSGGTGGAGMNGTAFIPMGGGGGGGGSSQGTTNANGGAGGAGGVPGGGGGGGGAGTSAGANTGGTGGTGGRGEVRVWTYRGTGADLAETYSTNDEALESGDVVSIDPSLISGVKKTSKAYDANAIGVISTQPSLVMGVPQNEGVKQVLIALAGRIPVKVNLDNGPIKQGDYLTPSGYPGVAMKATKAGIIIGQAMTEYDGSQPGYVIAFVKNSFSQGTNENNLGGEAALDDVMNSVNVATDSASTNISTINTDRILAGLEVITPNLTAKEINVKNIKVSGITTLNDLFLLGKLEFDFVPLFNKDTAGFAEIKKGDSEVNVQFEKEYTVNPVINVSPIWDTDKETLDVMKQLGNYILPKQEYIIVNSNSKGFSIVLEKPAVVDLKFSWIAIAAKDVTTTLSGQVLQTPKPVVDTSPMPVSSQSGVQVLDTPSPIPTISD